MRLFLELNEKTDDILKAVREGYGARFHDNILADRRDHENLHPVPANEKLGIPEPKVHSPNCKKGIIVLNETSSISCEWCASKK